MNLPASQQSNVSAPKNGAVTAPIQAFQGGRSQATQVEQARAIAEVQAAVLVAHERPRVLSASIEAMMEACRTPGMAERSFFSFPRAGQTVTGASVHLARELARCWGNIAYGVKELSRNDAKGESELLAFAIDLETNTRNETTFIVPHARDTKQGRKALTELRDVYESNANQGARRVRECIFAVLPKYITDMAEEECRKTLENGGDEPLPQRRVKMVAYAESMNVTRAMIEKREGTKIDDLTAAQLANLKILFRSLKNGEISRDEAFPETPAADVTQRLAAKEAQQQVAGETAPETKLPAVDATAPAAEPLESTEKLLLAKVKDARSQQALSAIATDYAEELDRLRTEAPGRYKAVMAAFEARKAELKR